MRDGSPIYAAIPLPFGMGEYSATGTGWEHRMWLAIAPYAGSTPPSGLEKIDLTRVC